MGQYVKVATGLVQWCNDDGEATGDIKMQFRYRGKRIARSTGSRDIKRATVVMEKVRRELDEEAGATMDRLSTGNCTRLSEAVEVFYNVNWRGTPHGDDSKVKLEIIIGHLNNPYCHSIDTLMVKRLRRSLAAEDIGSDDEPKFRAPTTVNRYIAALKTVMIDLQKQGYIDRLPEWGMVSEKQYRRDRVVTNFELEKVIEYCHQPVYRYGRAGGKRAVLLDKATREPVVNQRATEMRQRVGDLFLVLRKTGMRIGEATTIVFGRHIKMDRRAITITADIAKGKSIRTIPMADVVYEILSNITPGPDGRAFPFSKDYADKVEQGTEQGTGKMRLTPPHPHATIPANNMLYFRQKPSTAFQAQPRPIHDKNNGKESDMPRIPRMIMTDPGQKTVYHVISRTALDGLPFKDAEKDELVRVIKRFSMVYAVEVLGFSIMGNHWHLLVEISPAAMLSDDDVRRRFMLLYTKGTEFPEGQLEAFRERFCSLSWYVKDIKQTFSRIYNRKKKRRGTLWGERFKSVIVEKGETVINCLAYIDLNAVRAGIVKRPEDYRWCSIGHHVQTGNRDNFLSLDFGLVAFGVKSAERLQHYRKFLYQAGSVKKRGQAEIPTRVFQSEKEKDFELHRSRRFMSRTRYFTDSGIIGSKAFVIGTYEIFKDRVYGSRERIPRQIKGLDGMYSMKRLREA